ncbi:MAG: hypothetical protein IPL06_19875 [Betaproteobacteria bacterium]|nr:hypothetical protein [Betaproteobacteria bacterium]
MAADMVMPAGTIAEIWTQISGEQTKLTATIQNGQLKDVHRLAFAIRDLVVALADKAKATSPTSTAKLDGMVAQVKESAAKLDGSATRATWAARRPSTRSWRPFWVPSSPSPAESSGQRRARSGRHPGGTHDAPNAMPHDAPTA